MTQKPLFTLWHGTASGVSQDRLRAILDNGLTAAFNDPHRCGQQPGVYFSATRDYAVARALRCIGKLQRGGEPLLMSIETDLNPHEWDWDYEVSGQSAQAMIERMNIRGVLVRPSFLYGPNDYRCNVTHTEQLCRTIRDTGYRSLFARHFTAAAHDALRIPGIASTVAFKYTGREPLRVKTVEFI